jgi:anti-repressor protein
MNDMVQFTQFTFEGWNLNVIYRDGHPWWILHEVCRLLDLGNSREVSSRLDDDEKGTIGNVISNDIHPNTTIINESGLYNVILTCRKENAKRFKKWVTAEVLPSIRKTGSYGTPSAIDYNDPQLLIGLLEKLRGDVDAGKKKIEDQRRAIEVMKPKADLTDTLISTIDNYTLTETAVLIGADKSTICIDKLFRGELGLLYRTGQHKTLMAYAEYRQSPNPIFEHKVNVVTKSDGTTMSTTQVVVTAYGLTWIKARADKVWDEKPAFMAQFMKPRPDPKLPLQ